MTAPSREQITGLVLAGGRGTRMGGLDKGLVEWKGQPLVQHALARLAPQVGALAINANRHLEQYRRLDVPVWPDALPDYPGPLAGLLTGLRNCATPWLVTVPCDSPCLPADLALRLAETITPGATLVVAARTDPGGVLRREPVFCLAHVSLADGLAQFLSRGGRRVGEWMDGQSPETCSFDRPGDAAAFANANTPEELAALEQPPPGAPTVRQ